MTQPANQPPRPSLDQPTWIEVELQHDGEVVNRTLAVSAAGQCQIGRDPECALVLEDPAISRTQASINWCDNAWKLRHLGKTNTLLDGISVTEDKPLREGQMIRIGRYRILILRLPDLSGRLSTVPLGRITLKSLVLDVRGAQAMVRFGLPSNPVREISDQRAKLLERLIAAGRDGGEWRWVDPENLFEVLQSRRDAADKFHHLSTVRTRLQNWWTSCLSEIPELDRAHQQGPDRVPARIYEIQNGFLRLTLQIDQVEIAR